MIKRIARWLAPVALTAGLLGLASGAAYAGTGNQWASDGLSVYANAWNGGPDGIATYTAQTINNDFTKTNPNNGYAWMQLSNDPNSTYYAYCISDYGNNQYSARAGLNPCSPTSNPPGVPWGANFTTYNCTTSNGNAGQSFYNAHWGGYLGPSGQNNGDRWYLNQTYSDSNCLLQVPPA